MRSADARILAVALLAAGAAALPGAPARAQSVPPPSLSVDTSFFPSTGIARDGEAGTGTDIPSAIAVDRTRDRIYVVGESNGDVAIIARKGSGAYDTAFSGDGKLMIPVDAGKDVGMGIALLPDGRLRVLASTDSDDSTSINQDVALIGLTPEGANDPTFGGGTGRVVFPIGTIDDFPQRLALDGQGRIAVAGYRKDSNGKEDGFVALRNADGSPLTAFDTDGIVVYDRAGSSLNDRAVDIVWRPGGGVVAAWQIATNADVNVNDYVAALHAFDETGAHHPGFSEDGDLPLGVGEPNTIPGALVVHAGQLYVTGSTRSGQDTDSFLARAAPDGTGLVSRKFDMRGSQIGQETAVVSGGGDIAVLPGNPSSMVVVGSTTYNSRTYWSAAVFAGIEGDIMAARSGDVLIPTDEYGALLGVDAGNGYLAATGSLLNVNGNFDTSFGTIKLLVDADKTCDLAVTVPRPLEITFQADQPAQVDVEVTNRGTRACSGEVSVDAPFAFAPDPPSTASTGVLGPGASVTIPGRLTYRGERRREAVATFRVSATGDVVPANNTRLVNAVFRYCDLRLRTVGAAGWFPVEGTRRYEVSLRNLGTARCEGVRVAADAPFARAGGRRAFAVRAGRSASEFVRVRLRGAVPDPLRLLLRAQANGDIDPDNDTATLGPRLAPVGDSSIRAAGRRGVAGSASRAPGARPAKQRRVKRVQVAVARRSGGKCLWAKRSGKLRKRSCSRPVWLTARGTGSWRLGFQRALPQGSYSAQSRAVIGGGFHESRFSAADGNVRSFTVR